MHLANFTTTLLAPVAIALSVALTGCAASGHATTAATLGAAPPSSLEAVVDEPGPLSVETVVGAEWHVARSGLIDLDHPRAKAAHLVDGQEPILLMFHAIRHPTRGLFIVDTGAEKALRDDPSHAAVSGFVANIAHVADMRVETDTAGWLARQNTPLQGVFLTHLHLDHVSGMRDVGNAVPIFVGPGDAESRSMMNALTAGIIDRALEGKGPLGELKFQSDPDGTFAGLIDVFGDKTLWAIWVPGHTPGSTAYLARTPQGPVLLTGDACHTAWGWENSVEPGTFSDDRARSAESLARLEKFVARHPHVDVRLGHQLLASSRLGATLR